MNTADKGNSPKDIIPSQQVAFAGEKPEGATSSQKGQNSPAMPDRYQPSGSQYQAYYRPYLTNPQLVSEDEIAVLPDNSFNFINFNEKMVQELLRSGNWAKKNYQTNCKETVFRQLVALPQSKRRKASATYHKGKMQPREVMLFVNYLNLLVSLVRSEGNTALLKDRAKIISDAAVYFVANQAQFKSISLLNQALLAHAFSKVSHQNCKRATGQIAHGLTATKVKETNLFDVMMFTNAFSKFPDQQDCHGKVILLAKHLQNLVAHPRELESIQGFKLLAVSALVNGFSRFPEEKDCQAAVFLLADYVAGLTPNLNKPLIFDSQGFANLVNGFSKFPEEKGCQAALFFLAEQLASLKTNPKKLQVLKEFNEQNLANLVNGFSKFPEEKGCQTALFLLAERVASLKTTPNESETLVGFNEKNLAILVNGFSKFPEEKICQAAIFFLAEQVASLELNPNDLENVAELKQQDIINLVNGFCKFPKQEACQTAIFVLAKHLLSLKQNLPKSKLIEKFSFRIITNLVNNFSKFSDEDCCQAFCAEIAQEILAEKELGNQEKIPNSHLLLNAFGRWVEQPFIDASVKIAQELNSKEQWLNQAVFIELAMVVNSLSRLGGDMSEAQRKVVKPFIKKIAGNLWQNPAKFSESDPISLGMFLKGLFTARLHEEETVQELIPHFLNQIKRFAATNQLRQANLETVANLCVALLPVLRSFPLREQRGPALDLLMNKLHPFVKEKLDLYHQVQSSSSPQQLATAAACQTRNPALSIYQILKTYAGVVEQWTFANQQREGRTRPRSKRKEVEGWLKKVYQEFAPLITNDLSKYSWNLIAELEAENPTRILDDFIVKHQAEIIAQNSPTIFNYRQVFEELNKKPDLPPEGKGLTTVPEYNLRGKKITEGSKGYSILGRLTGEKLPQVLIDLPGKLSTYMLGRTVKINQIPYRFDLFGGNMMKAHRKTLQDMAGEPTQSKNKFVRSQAPYGKLMALPLAETMDHTPFTELVKKLFPYAESFFYFQRMLMNSPLEILGVEHPAGHVLEGRFQLGLLPDRSVDQIHSFQLKNQNGNPLALRPHDGCGFIKASLAAKMPAYQLGKNQAQYGGFQSGNLPSQALQHYPSNNAVAKETVSLMQQRLQEQSEPPRGEELFRYLTTGGIKGDMAIAVPAADNMVHLPHIKSAVFEKNPDAGLLVGKSPYDKPNLRPIEPDRVGISDQGDQVAKFLEDTSVIQYSFVGQDRREISPKEKPLFFAKGLLVVVPDELWPKNFANQDLVMSAEDVKSHSQWLEKKDRVTKDTLLPANGILVVTNLYPPGSCVATPITEQKKLDGDFDGDPLFILAGRPKLYKQVQEQDQQTVRRPSLKPPKTHTPVINEDQSYQFGRAGQIMSTRLGVLESFATIQNVFLAQPKELKKKLADRIVFTTFHSLPSNTKKQVTEALEDLRPSELQKLLISLKKQYDETPYPATKTGILMLSQTVQGVAKEQKIFINTPFNFQLNEKDWVGLKNLLAPAFEKNFAASKTAEERMGVLLHYLPERILEENTPGYEPGQPVETAQNLLSLGIKIGTDAYKSNTGIYKFNILAERLKSIIKKDFNLPLSVPYGKNLIKKLGKGEFDIDETLAALAQNPTLVGQIMDSCLKELRPLLTETFPKKSSNNQPPGVSKAKPDLTKLDIKELFGKVRLPIPAPDKATLPEIINLATVFTKDQDKLSLNSPNRVNLANLFSKFPEQVACQKGLLKLAQYIDQTANLQEYNPPQLALLANAFGMLEDSACQKATQKIAQTILEKDLRQFELKSLALLFNAFSKWRDPDFVKAGYKMASHLSQQRDWIRQENLNEKSLLANALSQLAVDMPSIQKAAVRTLLQQIVQQMVTNPKQLKEESTPLNMAQLLKGIFKMGLKNEGYQLAAPCLNRLQFLLQGKKLHHENLETLGNLCFGLIPLTNSTAPLAVHKLAANLLVEKLQPIINHKMEQYLAIQGEPSPSSSSGAAFDTRIPVISIYQILKTYTKLKGEKQNYFSSFLFRDLQFENFSKWVHGFESKTKPLITAGRKKPNQQRLLAEIDQLVGEWQRNIN